MEQLSDDDLDMVAAGGIGDDILLAVKTALFTLEHPVSTTANVIKSIANNDKARLGLLAAKIDSQDIYELGDSAVNKVVDKL